MKMSNEQIEKILDGSQDPYKCVVYDLTPLEAEKKLQDSIKRLGWLPPDEATALRQDRDELAATVERLREQLSAMAAQHQCGCGHPACNRCRDDADNRDVLRATPEQNLNAIKREVLLGLLSTMTCSECTCDRYVEHYANQRYPDKDGE